MRAWKIWEPKGWVYRENEEQNSIDTQKQHKKIRLLIEAKHGEEKLKAKVEEIAAKHRATGTAPKKIFNCF